MWIKSGYLFASIQVFIEDLVRPRSNSIQLSRVLPVPTCNQSSKKQQDLKGSPRLSSVTREGLLQQRISVILTFCVCSALQVFVPRQFLHGNPCCGLYRVRVPGSSALLAGQPEGPD